MDWVGGGGKALGVGVGGRIGNTVWIDPRKESHPKSRPRGLRFQDQGLLGFARKRSLIFSSTASN